MVYIFNDYPNKEVTNYYLDIVAQAVAKLGVNYKKVSFIGHDSVSKLSMIYNLFFKDFGYREISKNDWIVVANSHEIINLRLHGYKKLILWIQGVAPEESYMKNHSKCSKIILELIERLALRFSKFTFMVSNTMKKHYEEKYHFDFKNNCFIMPCFNTKLDLSSFDYPNKYIYNIFTYVGSTAAWQCFRETVKLYKQVEDQMPDSELKLFTSDRAFADKVCREYNVCNYTIKYVASDQLSDELKPCKFGFVIRENNVVNNVATPTKLSSYMASGVIPIFTDAIKDFVETTQNMHAICKLNEFYDVSTIVRKSHEVRSAELVKHEYTNYFECVYNEKLYIDKIAKKLHFIS